MSRGPNVIGEFVLQISVARSAVTSRAVHLLIEEAKWAAHDISSLRSRVHSPPRRLDL